MKKVKSTQSIAFSRYPPQRRNDIWNSIYAWSRPGALGKLVFGNISDPRFSPHCQEILHRYIGQCGSALGKFSRRRKLYPFAYRNSFFWFLLVSFFPFSVGVWKHPGECPEQADSVSRAVRLGRVPKPTDPKQWLLCSEVHCKVKGLVAYFKLKGQKSKTSTGMSRHTDGHWHHWHWVIKVRASFTPAWAGAKKERGWIEACVRCP